MGIVFISNSQETLVDTRYTNCSWEHVVVKMSFISAAPVLFVMLPLFAESGPKKYTFSMNAVECLRAPLAVCFVFATPRNKLKFIARYFSTIAN